MLNPASAGFFSHYTFSAGLHAHTALLKLTAMSNGPYNSALFASHRNKEMPKVTYITTDGERHEVTLENGYSVMEGAINNNIDGIVAECGGACACATCHSYIDDAWLDRLPAMDDMEDSMLDAAYDRRQNSRLTCQIEMNDVLDGLIVHVADNEA
jgi:2Fe-2S ferredoxin